MKRMCLAILALFLSTAAQADSLAPNEAQSIELDGGVRGIAYYTREQDGFRVVATVAQGETGLPLRFVATLADRQSLTISVPGGLGRPRQAVELSRQGDQLVLSRPQTDLSN